MNRVLNWVFGSFFRTLGRFLVYLLIGFLVAYALKDTKMPKFRLSDLLFMNVSAETFTNNNYMTWQLNKNGSRLNSGNNPFYTSVDNLTDYGNYDLYLFYNNYTAYNNYFYDVSLTIYFDNPFIFANRVRECNIYVEGSTNQKSDGCRVVDFTNSSLTIANYNIETLSGTGTFTSQFIAPVYQNNEITTFQVNSFKLDIVAKEDKSITSETFGNAINNVIDSQNNNANNIINNQNSNTQSIINNQNANTDKEIESQQVCEKEYNVNTTLGSISGTNGQNTSSTTRTRTDYLKISSNSQYTITLIDNNSALMYVFEYNDNYTFIDRIPLNWASNPYIFTSNSNAKYIRIVLDNSTITSVNVKGVCKNGNQAIGDSLNETNDFLTDDTPPDADISGLSTVQGLLPPGPVDSLLNIPVYFLSVLSSSMSGTCSPLQGDFIYDSTISIPCFSELIYENNSIPSALMLFINTIPSAFILIQYFKHLYKKVDRAVSMNASADDEWGVI